MKRRDRIAQQFAALPLAEIDGETHVLLVTSRETGRWVLPKGWAEPELTGAELASKEAFEEAGVVGTAAVEPIGSYTYRKLISPMKAVQCSVDVFPLRVTDLLDDWPEVGQRRREWFTLGQAAMQVSEGNLATLLLSYACSCPTKPSGQRPDHSERAHKLLPYRDRGP